MTGKLLIDDIDIYSAYGIFITEGGYNGLLSFPPLKEPDKNDWQEENGIEVDLEDVKLDTKQFSISLCANINSNINGFIGLITDGSYHLSNFAQIGIAKSLRLVSFTNFSGVTDLRLFNIELADDYPLAGYTYVAPKSDMVYQRGYALDGIDLSQYGVAILEGSNAEILKPNSVKPNLAIGAKNISGINYDGFAVTLKSKDVKLKCLMLAKDLTEFWTNYNALLYNLSKPGARFFHYNKMKYECYYKSSTTSGYSFNGRILYEFELNLVFTKLGVPNENI